MTEYYSNFGEAAGAAMAHNARMAADAEHAVHRQAATAPKGPTMTDQPEFQPCRTTRHCADHGWCRRCAPDFADVMSRVNAAVQSTDPESRHWGRLYEAIAVELRQVPALAPTAPAVAPTAPPAADLRDRIVRVLATADGMNWSATYTETGYGDLADAVLAVLPAPAPLSEVWHVWREDEPVWANFASAAAARQGTIDCWQEDEPACPDYSWDPQAGGARLELLVGGVHSGVYASQHPVYGGPATAPAAEQPADRRARYAAAIREESSRVDDIAIADAVMAVADAEQAALRAEVERLRADRAELIRQRDQAVMDTIKALPAPIDRATVLREAVEVAGQMGGRSGTDDHGDIDEGWNDACKAISTELRRLADEAQQPETEAWPTETDPPTHLPKGTNAEDCPACKGTNPPYPFLCPGPDAPVAAEAPCTCAAAGPEFAPAGHYADCPHAAPAPAPTEEPTP